MQSLLSRKSMQPTAIGGLMQVESAVMGMYIAYRSANLENRLAYVGLRFYPMAAKGRVGGRFRASLAERAE